MIHCLNSTHFNFVDYVPWFLLRVLKYISRAIASLSAFLITCKTKNKKTKQKTRPKKTKREREQEEKKLCVIRVNVLKIKKSTNEAFSIGLPRVSRIFRHVFHVMSVTRRVNTGLCLRKVP